MIHFLNVIVLSTVAALFLGCSAQSKFDATKPLEESFAKTDPKTKEWVDQVNSNLKAGKYSEATRALMPVVMEKPLTEEQKAAISAALQQINQGIAKDPGLDTKEMYEMRALLFRSVRGNARF